MGKRKVSVPKMKRCSGCSRQEVVEVMMQMAVYAGPASAGCRHR
jgi:alkylhydroperoxidase/carboxymuconolactone decarboxylase family protein YurZ